MAVRAANRNVPSYVWRDKENYTVGLGFRASEQKNNVKLDANALGGSVKWGPTGAAASVEVARVKVSGTSANGVWSGSMSAQALTASAKFGLEGDLAGKSVNGKDKGKTSSSGLTMFTAGAEAHVAKTTVAGGVKIGPVKLEASASVGYGASASVSVGASKKGFGAGAELGAGATVGVGFKITWDTGAAEKAIARASVPSRPPSYRSSSKYRPTITPD